MRTRRLLRILFGRRRRELSELSTSGIHSAILRAIDAADVSLNGEYLDLGSGTGSLIREVVARHPVRASACDYTAALMKAGGPPVDICNLNYEPLPYVSDRFSLVTCAETIEHLENHWAVFREVFRVLRPGGLAVFSTPNILNLRSRLRFFSSGFYNLFGPLRVAEAELESTRGHINPLSWFYLAHALLSVGFEQLKVAVDKHQRRSVVALPFFAGPIGLANAVVYRRERIDYRTIDQTNDCIVRKMNSRDLLLGRTVVVTVLKPG